MKHLSIIAVLTLILFSGCDKKTNNTSTAKGDGIAVCTNKNQGFDSATTFAKGDKITGESNHAKIRLWHLNNGIRKACVIEGEVSA